VKIREIRVTPLLSPRLRGEFIRLGAPFKMNVSSAPALWLNARVKTVGIIPARYSSTRFPGKPLALISGKPLVQHVVECCAKARSLAEIIVATDDARIAAAAKAFCRVEMTRPDHCSGTDRIA
jgi:hypothetical protein